MAVFRVFVEKKAPYAVEAAGLLKEIRHILLIKSVTGVRLFNRYDVEGLDAAAFAQCGPIVFYEPQLDDAYDALPEITQAHRVIASEYLPGQFDARAASCEECVQLVTTGERPSVRTARVYVLLGEPSDDELARIRQYLINPVESREADLAPKQTLRQQYEQPPMVPTLSGFLGMDAAAEVAFVKQYGLAMDVADLEFCRQYFAREQRDPTLTEIRMLDTYWSDHCRHTTFLTTLDDVQIAKPAVEKAFQRYLNMRRELYGDRERPVNLMDIATIGGKYLRKKGLLKNIDVSDEINACSIQINVDVDGAKEPWLLMFKNETHNHPTEIEPFGGAATCIGGAIRDPLSGRTYVYQAMRVTGAADPLVPVQDTMPGKLPQRKLVTTAAAGYSAYGNQIGLATGLVDELYHPGYAAKRLEIGAVVGAAPVRNIRREEPTPGDIVILLGGRTGRDGCGGATGSSKSHNMESIETCGAEVQKGNPVVERKLQRLFRDPAVTRLIKRCNDFGAGGVSVAIGELADGLEIDLDKVPKKYDGLDGTELAISESQERMAVVVAQEDAARFMALAHCENLEATAVATVTAAPRLRMQWRGQTIVDVSREFLNSNGAEKHAKATVADDCLRPVPFAGDAFADRLHAMVSDLNICCKKGLGERFDSTIGAGTVLMPYGGQTQLTPAQAMVAKLPVPGETETVSGMAYGFHPQIMEQSPFEGAYLSVAESVLRLAAAGFDRHDMYLTFQEYFERMTDDPARWGQPLSALLGALWAQTELGIAAIGGKDSMSGSFEKLDVPPTLVSFAVAPGKSGNVISPEFKRAGAKVCLLRCDAFDSGALKAELDTLYRLICEKQIVSAWALGLGGIAEGVFKMGLGNRLGFRVENGFARDLFAQDFGGVLVELAEGAATVGEPVGETCAEYTLAYRGETLPLDAPQALYEGKLTKVFPYYGEEKAEQVPAVTCAAHGWPKPAVRVARPVAVIPAFPGTNCEMDTARALRRAGADPRVLLVRNLSASDIAESLQEAERLISQAQMIVFPGGFSGGDEPDGSGKFITAFFRNPRMKDALADLMERRDGLMLGICNGFQALVKLGLLPEGRIIDTDASCPTLTYNTIGRHQSMLVTTRIASNKSPWLQLCKPGELHTIAISHGEGRFVASPAVLEKLKQNGQIAAQYVDLSGQPTMDLRYNPNGSALAIEAVASPDGRILGKMGHSERSGRDLYKNVEGNTFQPLFEGGVKYFE